MLYDVQNQIHIVCVVLMQFLKFQFAKVSNINERHYHLFSKISSNMVNRNIQNEDFLDTSKHPTMTFSANKLKFAGENVVAVDGTLTLKGISKPLTLTVTSFQCMPHPMLKKDACGANATAVIKRTDFNMGKYAPNVGDEVTITIPVEAVKE